MPRLEHEQLRDLARCREDARQDLMRAKNRIGKFLLRRELYLPLAGGPRVLAGRGASTQARPMNVAVYFDVRAVLFGDAGLLNTHKERLMRDITMPTLPRRIAAIALAALTAAAITFSAATSTAQAEVQTGCAERPAGTVCYMK